jgi:hypothetical protein
MIESPLPEGLGDNLAVITSHSHTGRNFNRINCLARSPTGCTDYGYTLPCCPDCSYRYCIRPDFSFIDFAPFLCTKYDFYLIENI